MENKKPSEMYKEYKKNITVEPVCNKRGEPQAFFAFNIKRKGAEVPNGNLNSPTFYRYSEPKRPLCFAMYQCIDPNLNTGRLPITDPLLGQECDGPTISYVAVPLYNPKASDIYSMFELEDPNAGIPLYHPADVAMSSYPQSIANCAKANKNSKAVYFNSHYCQKITVKDENGDQFFFGMDIGNAFYQSNVREQMARIQGEQNNIYSENNPEE